ncbi:hypothetical protein [Blastopirellula marina]|uniref:Uncharacterized protein n=1 Tax=Blastopirellula marina TaxID=124 RepID=A0A2S8GP24_9BACT|nr:hypothetical protein [Blastopirellula marina]PQO46172.1 hypothetical protein C5Y93_09280 [Blastopirellula marina]
MNSSDASRNETEPRDASPPARLAGERLEAWYRKSPPLASDDRRPIQEYNDRNLAISAATAGLLVVTFMSLVNVVIPVFGPFLASLLGIWLVIGRSNLIARCFSVLAALLFLTFKAGNGAMNIGMWNELYLAGLTMCTFLAAVLSYVLALVVPRAYQAPSRLAQFSLRGLGGLILAIGLAAALTRGGMTEFLQQPAWNVDQRAIVVSFIAVSVNTALVSLNVLVPKRFRDRKLFWISVGMVMVVTPAIEGSIFSNWFRIPLPIAVLGIAVLHAVVLMIVWSILFCLELAGAFRDEEDLPSTTTEAATGHWEEME